MTMTTPGQEQPAKKSFPIWLVLLLLVPVGLCGLGLFSSLAIYGVRKYLVNAKTSEGVHVVARLSSEIARCAREADESGLPRGLPDTAPRVPASFADVAGKKYMSAPAEWSAPAYRCARFTLMDPQYFQYQWVRLDPNAGNVAGQADFDGDGVADVTVVSTVMCNPDACHATTPITTP